MTKTNGNIEDFLASKKSNPFLIGIKPLVKNKKIITIYAMVRLLLFYLWRW